MFLMLLLVLLLFVSILTLLSLPHVFPEALLRPVRRLVVAFDLLTAAGLVLGPMVFRGASLVGGTAAILLRIASVGLVVQVLFAVLTGGFFLWQKLAGLRGNVPYNRDRRRVLRRAAAVPMLALAGGLYGGLYEKSALVEHEYFVPIKNLPNDLRGLRIAQLSDVHLGWFFSMDDLRALLERAAQGTPDVLVITGDLFDDETLNEKAVGLADSYADRFPLGIWFCYGNHEHRRNFEALDAMLDGTRIHKLVNASTIVQDGTRPLVFAGVDYPFAHGDEAFQAKKKELADAAFQNVPKEAVTILLAHHPEFIDDGAARGAALVLTGHTHGCQFGLLGHPLLPVFKYNRGIVKIGETMGYVHSGNGSWFPYRIGCPPEIAYFTLRRA